MDSCKHNNEPSGSATDREFLEYVSSYKILKDSALYSLLIS
jgi:hypothetical protein